MTPPLPPLSIAPFDGPVWRLLPHALAATPCAPAAAPQGRFHHGGQVAAYASLSAEGAAVAIARYLADGVARMLVPMRLVAHRVVDARGDATASIVWQDLHATGQASPTWRLSDRARQAGADAMLYSSRSRPDLVHVVVFRPECLTPLGPPTPFAPT